VLRRQHLADARRRRARDGDDGVELALRDPASQSSCSMSVARAGEGRDTPARRSASGTRLAAISAALSFRPSGERSQAATASTLR
jgi:hypothetical protein